MSEDIKWEIGDQEEVSKGIENTINQLDKYFGTLPGVAEKIEK
jgi:hypothetical protein